MVDHHVFIAKTYQGLEQTLSSELSSLGAKEVRVLNKGVRFEGSKALMYEANLRLRTATRVLALWEEFEAKNEPSFYEGIKAIDWSAWIGMKDSFAVDIILTTEVFRNATHLTKHTTEAITEQVRRKTGRRANMNEDKPTVRFHIHVHETMVLVYLDSSCEPLSWRGWRKGKHEGRVSDALFAGMVMRGGWRGKPSFLDGQCGTASVIAEAAMVASGVAPGLTRESFGFQRWHAYDADLFKAIKTKAIIQEHHMEGTVTGWSRSVLDINTSQRHLVAANLAKMVQLEKVNFLRPAVPSAPGLLFLFVDEVKAAAYVDILKTIHTHFAAWQVILAGPEGEWHQQMGLDSHPDILVAEQGRKLYWCSFLGSDLKL